MSRYAVRNLMMQAVADDDQINASLDDMIALMEQEVERLRESLAFVRLSRRPDRDAMVRWHVQTLDERQDALEDLKRMLRRRDERQQRCVGNTGDFNA